MIKKLTDRVIISVFRAIKNMISQQEGNVSCFMLGSLHRMMVMDFHRERGEKEYMSQLTFRTVNYLQKDYTLVTGTGCW